MTSSSYRMIGTTDTVVDCAQCGRVDLKMTVVLEFLDAEGNSEGVTYFGSTCAARALRARGVSTTTGKVALEAQAAQTRREAERNNAEDLLAYFRPEDDGAIARYRKANPYTGQTDDEILARFAALEELAR